MEKGIKILHIITSPLDRGGGTQGFLFNLCTLLQKLGFKNIVVSLRGTGFYGALLRKTGIKVYPLNLNGTFKDVTKIVKLLRLVRKEKPDLVQTWLYHANLLGFLLAKLFRKKIIWCIRSSDMDFSRYGLSTMIAVKLCTYFSKFVDLILINSKKGEYIHRRIGYEWVKLSYIPNGFELPEVVKCSPSYHIGVVARFDPMKGYETFFKALKKILRIMDVKAVVYGRGCSWENGGFCNAAGGYSVKNSIEAAGVETDISKMYGSFSVLVLPSLSEGFPNVLGEAMAYSKPCVATDVGDVKYVLGKCGIVVPPGNPSELSKAVLYLLLKPSLGKKFGLWGKARIQKLFLLEEIVTRFVRIYERVCVE